MKAFACQPDALKIWANNVFNYLNGDSDSIIFCIKKLQVQIETLTEPNIWTGPLANNCYQKLLDIYQNLINFFNHFSESLTISLNSLNTSLQHLEIVDSNLNQTLTDYNPLKYPQLPNNQNLKTDTITWNYNKIFPISLELEHILTTLEKINVSLRQKIDELNNESGIWDGNSAAQTKENLTHILSTYMPKIMENIQICINNIKELNN